MSKRAKIRLIFYAITSLVIAIAILLVTVAVSAIVLFSTPDKIGGKYTVILDDENEKSKPIVKTVSAESIYIDRTWYINYSEISDFYGFAVSGEKTFLKFTCGNDSNDIMIIDFDKDVVLLNGVSIRCQGPIMRSDGTVYLPAEILSDYFEGVDYKIDTKEKKFTVICREECFLTVRNQTNTPKIDKTDIFG
jgi:hypothetical protein